MSQNKYQNIWKLLQDYSFHINNESEDILCSICKKIMINACNGPCGCRYCLECISKHLTENYNVCPGETDSCKNDQINTTHLQMDNAINMKISRSIVNCPLKDCNYICELRLIENHLRMCNFRQINCPLFEIGCKQSNLINDNMKDHFQSEIISHFKLFLESFGNMKNEIEAQSKVIKEMKKENRLLKDKIILLESQHIVSNQFVQDLVEIKNNLKSVENDSTGIKKLIGNICFDDLICKINNQNGTIKDIIETQLPNLTLKVIDIEKLIDEKQIYNEFEWILENYSKQDKDTNIFSNSFYSHRRGYKMCVSVNIGEFWFLVGLSIMQGDYDEDLSWPFKHAFTIDVINQYDTIIHKSITIKYEDFPNHVGWNKPITVYNATIYGSDFLLLSPKIIRNDRMIIRCKINFLTNDSLS